MNFKAKHGLGVISEVQLDDNALLEFKSAEITAEVSEVTITKKEPKQTLLKKENTLDELHFKFRDFLTITIPDNYVSNKPIVIKKHLTGNSCNQTCIYAGKNSKAKIIIELTGGKLVSFASEFIEIYADDNSEINYSELNMLDNTIVYSKRRGVAKENSKINWLICDVGGIQVISETKTKLDGKNSSTTTNNVYFASNNQKYDFSVIAEHANEGTLSNLKSRGVLKESEVFVRGLVQINENAPESNGYQKADSLLLDDSRVVSIPDLLIHNEKVKCSHGSTISRLDKEKLFYMQSRGLSKKQAEMELLQGFIEPALKDNLEALPRFLGVMMEKLEKEEAHE